eukprot:7917739-Karenia_brevis.AAC.1
MLRPIFDQCSRRDGKINCELLDALKWWVQAFELGISGLRDCEDNTSDPVHIFADASGDPMHLGAVLAVDGTLYWTHARPPRAILEKFKSRKDSQIMGLELLAISLAFSTFEEFLVGRNIV